jgi:hypothetical protein
MDAGNLLLFYLDFNFFRFGQLNMNIKRHQRCRLGEFWQAIPGSVLVIVKGTH